MKKVLPLLFVFCLLLISKMSHSQSGFCGFDDVRQADLAEDSAGFVQKQAAFVAMVNRYRMLNPDPSYYSSPPPDGMGLVSSGCQEVKYLVPVVVHVIYDPGDTSTNISDAQINNAIDEMNKAFRNAASYYLPAVNTGIQFCLAKKNAFGASISGIYRVSSTYSVHRKMDYIRLTTLSFLPPDQYVNIYVVKDIRDTSGAASNITGYATYPNRNKQYEYIVVRYNWFGNYLVKGSPLNSAARGLTLAHEMGHYLGLFHTFEKNCAGTDTTNCKTQGDLCCDTPPVNGSSSVCASPLVNTCKETPIDKPDQKENYMDYSPDTCKYLFTADQTSLMHAVLENWRSQLVSPSNINTTAPNCCYLSSNFEGSNFGCKNDSLTFTGIKYTDTAFYTWNIYRNGSLYRSYSDSIRYVWKLTIADTGRYDVELLVTDQAKTSTTIKKLFLTIVDCANPLQHTNANWYFGKHAGVKFRTSAVIRDIEPSKNKLPYQINAEEGSLSISNKRGQLLFYGGTDSSRGVNLRIYGKNYKQLIGSPIYGDYTANQAGIIIPYQKDTNKYHVFTMTGPNNSGGGIPKYYHSVVDMSLVSSSPGEVTTKNEVLTDSLSNDIYPTSECMNIIPKCQNKGHWLLFFGGTPSTSYQEKLFIFKVDSTGYSFYKTANIYSGNSNETGMKVSPDGTLITVGTFLYLFDRSNATFKLMNSDSTQYLTHVYGASFSPDSKKLFRIDYYNLANFVPSGTDPVLAHKFYLYQYDPYSYDKFLSKSFIKQVNYHKQMQLGPDNKIYLSALEQNYISNIPNPNTKNTLSNQTQFNEVAVELSQNCIGGGSTLGLPNFSDALPVTQVTPTINIRPVSCKAFEFYPSECCAASFKWVFGDGDSTTTKYATHTYSDTGNYTIILRTPGRNVTRTIHVGISGTRAKIFGDTLICDTMVNLEYLATYYDDVNYKWSGTGYKSFIIFDDRVNIKWNGPGSVKLVLTNKADGCKDSATINVSLNPIAQNNTIPDTTIICDTTNTTPIIGSTPTGISGTFSYKWYYQLKDDSTWQLIDTATHKNFNPCKLLYGTRLIREINKGGCRNFSNIGVVIILSHTNKIVLGNHPCFKGARFKANGDTTYGNLGAYINWQYSNNGTDWNYYDVHTQNLDTLMHTDNNVYIRRLVDYTDYCEVPSNVIQLRNYIKISQQPQNYYTCQFKHAEFSISLYNRYNLPVQYYVRWYDSASHTWSTFNKTTRVHQLSYIAKYSSTDSIQYAIHTPCGIMYSNKVLLKIRSSGPDIDSYPSDQYLNEGDRTNLVGAVFNPYEAGLSYNWQYRINLKSYNGVPHSWAYKAPEWKYVTDSVRNKLELISGICDDSTEYRFVANNGCNSYSYPARLYMTNMADLWMKDSDRDTGAEPNRFVARKTNPSQRTQDIFKSPDLFNCQNSPTCTAFENAEYKLFGNNYVHFKIRNKGVQKSKPARLYLYWTIASTSESWDRDWRDSSHIRFKDNGSVFLYRPYFATNMNPNSPFFGQRFPYGGAINKTGILIRPLDTSQVLDSFYAWTPPNPKWYHVQAKGKFIEPTKLQICLLARIEYCDEFPHAMAFNEIYRVNVDTNVINNNNIVTHNLWVSDALPGGTPWSGRPRSVIWTRVNQPREVPGPITLRFNDAGEVYNPSVRVIAHFDDSLWTAWTEGGSVGSGFIPLDSQRVEITDVSAEFSNILSDSMLIGNIGFEFLPLDTNVLPIDTSYYTLSQTCDEDGAYDGGVIFRVDFNTTIWEAGGGHEGGGGSEPYRASINPKEKINKYLLYPNPANTKLTVSVTSSKNKDHTIIITDLAGRTLITEKCEFLQSDTCSKEIDISRLAAGVYLVRLTSGNKTEVRKINILR